MSFFILACKIVLLFPFFPHLSMFGCFFSLCCPHLSVLSLLDPVLSILVFVLSLLVPVLCLNDVSMLSMFVPVFTMQPFSPALQPEERMMLSLRHMLVDFLLLPLLLSCCPFLSSVHLVHQILPPRVALQPTGSILWVYCNTQTWNSPCQGCVNYNTTFH